MFASLPFFIIRSVVCTKPGATIFVPHIHYSEAPIIRCWLDDLRGQHCRDLVLNNLIVPCWNSKHCEQTRVSSVSSNACANETSVWRSSSSFRATINGSSVSSCLMIPRIQWQINYCSIKNFLFIKIFFCWGPL